MRILELRLATRDLQGQREFYAGTLGLRVVEDAPERLAVQLGSTRLMFDERPEAAGAYHLAFNIPENKLAEAKRGLSGRAALLTQNGRTSFTPKTGTRTSSTSATRRATSSN